MRLLTTFVSSALLIVLASAQSNTTSTTASVSTTVSLSPAQSSEAACLAACKYLTSTSICRLRSDDCRLCHRCQLQSKVHCRLRRRLRPTERNHPVHRGLPSRKRHSGRKSCLRKLPEGLSRLGDSHSSINRCRNKHSWFRNYGQRRQNDWDNCNRCW